jgi:hypothetical protein
LAVIVPLIKNVYSLDSCFQLCNRHVTVACSQTRGFVGSHYPRLSVPASSECLRTCSHYLQRACHQSEKKRASILSPRSRQIISWERFTQSVGEAEKLARSEDFDYLGLLGNHYSQFRRYTPTFLEAFEFKAAPVTQKLLDAIEILKGLTTANSRSVPDEYRGRFFSHGEGLVG